MNDAIRMQLSAYVDGELPENEAELLLRRMSQDAELRREVAEYLAIGRVMRGEVSVAGTDSIRDLVADRIGWLHLKTADGKQFAELICGDCRESDDWRRLQVIWRHIGAAT